MRAPIFVFAALIALAPAGCASSELDGPTAPGEVSVADFHRELDAHGTWIDSGKGIVFKPNAPPDFQPYLSNGRWVMGDEGWEFESEDPWQLTYHYGRWFNDAALGWVWAPDTVWGPSWVEWREGDPYIGWYVLPPLGMSYDVWGWVWVRTPHFLEPRLAAHVVRGDEVGRAWVAAKPVPRGASAYGGQWSVGPEPARVAAVAHRAVPHAHHGHAGHGGAHHSHAGGGHRH